MSGAVYDFSGRRVLVTGGGQGIGRAIVQKFHDAKADVIFVVDNNQSLLDSLSSEFPRVKPILVDLLDWNKTREAVASVAPIHHLVNNAGVVVPGPFLEADEKVVDFHYGVNLKAVINVSQTVAKGMIAHQVGNGATIVSVSSYGDNIANPNFGIYSATKAGVMMLTKAMAVELAQHKIRVNAVRPGNVNTNMANVGAFFDKHPELKKSIQGKSLLGGLIEPSEIADAVIYLSSSASSAITGTGLAVDAGNEIH